MKRTPHEGGSALRWAAAGAAALGLHAAVLAVLVRTATPAPPAAGGGDAIAVDLDPVEGDSTRPDEAAAPAEEATTASAPAADAAASQATPPPPDPAPPTPAPPPAPPPLPAPPPPVEQPPDSRPAPPRVAMPPTPASQASAAAAAAEDAAPVERKLSSAREAAWRGRLVPHLNRFRRFPPGLRGGTARVGFTLDGGGRVTAVVIVTTSGDAALDVAARDLVERASPFPAPPPGVSGAGLTFVVPVHYDDRRP